MSNHNDTTFITITPTNHSLITSFPIIIICNRITITIIAIDSISPGQTKPAFKVCLRITIRHTMPYSVLFLTISISSTPCLLFTSITFHYYFIITQLNYLNEIPKLKHSLVVHLLNHVQLAQVLHSKNTTTQQAKKAPNKNYFKNYNKYTTMSDRLLL